MRDGITNHSAHTPYELDRGVVRLHGHSQGNAVDEETDLSVQCRMLTQRPLRAQHQVLHARVLVECHGHCRPQECKERRVLSPGLLVEARDHSGIDRDGSARHRLRMLRASRTTHKR